MTQPDLHRIQFNKPSSRKDGHYANINHHRYLPNVCNQIAHLHKSCMITNSLQTIHHVSDPVQLNTANSYQVKQTSSKFMSWTKHILNEQIDAIGNC